MGKSREMFNRERERQSSTISNFIDDSYQAQEWYKSNNQLSDLFKSFGEIFNPAK